MNYLIGVDLGTQGAKACIRDEAGRVAGEGFAPSVLLYPEEGAVTQDPEEMLASVLTSIRLAMEQAAILPSTVAAVTLDGQMAGILGVDRAGMAATPYDSWLDTRCGAWRRPFLEYGEDRVIRLTGGPVAFAHGPKILWWREERPEVYGRIHKFVPPAAYCTMRMCGLPGDEAFEDHTYLHFSGFADTERRLWSRELLDAIGVREGKLPRILRPHDIAGRLTADMAAACGLVEGIPMAAGCGDTAASVFGAGVTRPGLLLDVAGTASVLGCATDSFSPDVAGKTILCAPSVLDDLYFPMAYINGGGMCLKWLRDDVLGGTRSLGELDALAETVPPGCEGLIFVPHFSGRVCPNDGNVRGAYLGLSWRHTAAHLYRAILEGIACEYSLYAGIIRKLAPALRFEQVISVGGGSRSEVFRQIKADVLATTVSTISVADTASLACCAIGGYAVGLYPALTTLPDAVITGREATAPNRDLEALYRDQASQYERCLNGISRIRERPGG